jgi:hypothetical protein
LRYCDPAFQLPQSLKLLKAAPEYLWQITQLDFIHISSRICHIQHGVFVPKKTGTQKIPGASKDVRIGWNIRRAGESVEMLEN